VKYRKKPVVIEAEQYLPGDPSKFPDGVCVGACGAPIGIAHIHTLEGEMTVSPSDFVITGVKGERYPCKPDIFWATYEAVEQ
jgi:hypothetical protein